MIEGEYSHIYNPPVPVVEIEVEDLFQSKKEKNIKCVLDTGSSMTIIPSQTREELQLSAINIMKIKDWEGNEKEVPIYHAKVWLGNDYFNVDLLESKKNENIGVIGRDILNKWIALLNGPKEEFSLDK